MPGHGEPSLYDLLGVAPDASQPELTRAYRRRAREVHPDRAAHDGHEAFAALVHAYRVLSNPARRATYDSALREPAGLLPGPGTRISVQVLDSARPARPRRVRRQPPIVAGPTRVYPIHPKVGR